MNKIEIKKYKVMYLSFSSLKFSSSEAHKIRGYIGAKLKQYDVLHNHNLKTGKHIYRYPFVQYKVVDDKFVIMGITEKVVRAFKELLCNLDEVVIEDKRIPVFEKEVIVREQELGISEEMIKYKFVSPWLGLNQKNYKLYKVCNNIEKEDILKKSLIGNILSMCHKQNGLDYFIDERLKINLNLGTVKTILKGNDMLGFIGSFEINFIIPKWLGIGKECSRGFGSVERI